MHHKILTETYFFHVILLLEKKLNLSAAIFFKKYADVGESEI